MNDKELGSLLLSLNMVSEENLGKALDEMKKLKRPLEKVIVEMGFIPRQKLYEVIARHQGFNFARLDNVKVPQEAVKRMPESLAIQTQSVPFKMENGNLFVAMAEPSDLFAIDQIQMQSGMHVEAFMASPEDIEEARLKVYAQRQQTESLMQDFADQQQESPIAARMEKSISEGTSIIKLVDLIIAQAVHDRASDIHIEPEQELMRIRFRIDGILHEVPSPPKDWEAAIISRIKVLAGMDIAESRIPQDGHFQSKIEDKIIDFRISTMPTIYGENVVMRLLDTASVMIGLEKLGFATHDLLEKYEHLISKPYGIILSTGPTGSGKTTTLYSALMRINTIDRNIITIEDPVEYQLKGISQIQVNRKIDLTFAKGLRSIVRQDPDIILVGEIRDRETAEIAVQSALTGHLVFSTLHTNDSATAITRLVDIGVEPFLIASSVLGVVAQRLVRVLCTSCKEAYTPDDFAVESLGITPEQIKEGRFFRAKGCPNCFQTGYKGRIGIFEIMVLDNVMKSLILKTYDANRIKEEALKNNMVTLRQDGIQKLLNGITTIEEVIRVTQD